MDSFEYEDMCRRCMDEGDRTLYKPHSKTDRDLYVRAYYQCRNGHAWFTVHGERGNH